MWVQAQLDFERIAGISMSVVHDQELIWSGGFGYSDIETKKPATPRTIYSICSISKLFTSVGMLQLRDRGLLRLDDPVEKHLSWFDIKQQYEHSPPITIEGLLTHSSGLPREADFPYWTEASFPTREQMIDHLSKQETLYPARNKYQYSNLGLSLAGEIVARVSGKPYSEYIEENILRPLGLTDTTPEIPVNKQKGQLATGYGAFRRDGTRPVMPFYTVNGIAPAAGFASTVEDLGKFASWQFRLLASNGNELLPANTLRDMHRVHWINSDWTSKRGLGFSVWRDKDK
ncbi:MAG: beta-lactamase family protein, partial [Proteobacteria bacterium]|nr:beta-lactamase family protein [Pseudomonadota bacterium]